MDTEQDFGKYIEEENSYGLPIEPVEPVPEPAYQAPMPTMPILDRLVPLKHIFGLCVGILLIGISIGMYLNEFEWTWEK